MSLEVRRVVTGHDENGKAIVEIDEISKNVIERRPGAHSTVIWATNSYPPDLNDLLGPWRALSSRPTRRSPAVG